MYIFNTSASLTAITISLLFTVSNYLKLLHILTAHKTTDSSRFRLFL